MTDKLYEFQKKYGTTKTLSTIKSYVKEHSGIEVWEELEKYIKEGYLEIPNIHSWYRDFVLAGSEKVYLLPLLLEPYTHTINPRSFNAYCNISFGDMLALLRSCNDYGMERVEVMDFGETIVFLGALSEVVTRKAYKGFVGSNTVAARVDWLTRCALAALTGHEDVMKTKYVLHLSNMYSALKYTSSVFDQLKPLIKPATVEVDIAPNIYQGLVNGTYFAYTTGMKLREGFNKPDLVIHEMGATECERQILSYSEFGDEDVVDLIRTLGPQGVLNTCKWRFTKSAEGGALYRSIEAAIREGGSELQAYIPNEYCERVHDVIHSRNASLPDGVSIVLDHVCEMPEEIPKTQPLATCVINIDKLMQDNPTRSTDWIMNTVMMLYSHAQDINFLRESLQTNEGYKTLLVVLQLSNKELQDELEGKIKAVNARLVSSYGGNLIYKFRGGNG